MFGLETPGVYWQPVARDAAAPEIRLDRPVFLGIAERGPLDRPVRVGSLKAFEAHFGQPIDGGFLAYAVRAFFENGGTVAWIVRIASRDAATGAAAASVALLAGATPSGPAAPSWALTASSPGSWGNRLDVSIQPGTTVAARSLGVGHDPFGLPVGTLAGFGRDDLVRLSQGATTLIRAVADVEVATSRLLFAPTDPARLRPWHRPLTGLDPSRPIDVQRLTATVIVRLDGRVAAVARDLAFVPDHPRYGPAVLAAPDYPLPPESNDPAPVPFPVMIEALAEPGSDLLPLVPADGLALSGGRDGLSALGIADFTGAWATPAEGPRGIGVLDLVDEPALVAIPDVCIVPAPAVAYERVPRDPGDPCDPCGPPEPHVPVRPAPVPDRPPVFGDEDVFALQQAAVEHCEARRDRLALIDPPWSAVSDPRSAVSGLLAWRSRFDSSFAAFYAPWIVVIDPRDVKRARALPPSGHVAGQYALCDALAGPHCAPANRDIEWMSAASLPISAEIHGLLNSRHVNVIRTGQGRAPRILGSRLVTSDPDLGDVPVRRVVILLRRAFAQMLRDFAFEPNTPTLRLRVAQTVDVFMAGLWGRGAFAGATPQEAYAVRCDDGNNPQQARDDGRLVCDVAFAPVRPLEFVVVRIGIVGNEIEVGEQTVTLMGGRP